MPRLLRWLGRIALAVVALMVVAVGVVYALSERELGRASRAEIPPFIASLPSDSADLAEGERIARTRGCFGCHGAGLEGKVFFSEPRIATLTAPNIPALVRQATDAQLERAIRHGVGIDGRTLFAMPSEMYRVLTDDDMARLLAWMRTLPDSAAAPPIPPRSVGPLGRLGILLGEFRPSRYYIENETIPPAPADSTLRAGHYIAWSSCTECHGGELAGDGRGSPPLAPMAHAYSLEEFAEFLTTGTAKGGRELELMSGVARGRLRHLRTDEVASLHAYLKTLPATSTVDPR